MSRYRSWQQAMEYVNVTDDWKADRECWPEWTWPHVTDEMVNGEDNLPFRLIYAVLIERSGLPPMTRAVLHYLARRCGGERGNSRRCWPKVDTIADRIGTSRRTVQRSIMDAERAGWVLVVRHTKKPSDYVLDVPNLKTCPCIDCTREGVRESPQGVTVSPQGGHSVTPEGVTVAHALGSLALGSSPHSEHLRASPTGDGTDGAEMLSKEEEQDKIRASYRNYGAEFADKIASNEMTSSDVERLAGSLSDDRRAWFFEGLREAVGEVA